MVGDELLRALAVARSVLEDALEREANLSAVGRVGSRLEIERAERVSQNALTGVTGESVPCVDGLVIVGLPRTGTTFLHRELAGRLNLRALRGWEAFAPGMHDPGVRNECQERFETAVSMSPRLASLHPLDADSPEECTPLLQNSFRCLQWAIMFHVPSYVDWLLDADLGSAYDLWSMQLHLIDPEASRWLLKSPLHFVGYEQLTAKLAPTALLVHIRRPAPDFMRSFLNLAEAARLIFVDDLDPHQLGEEWIGLWPRLCDRAERGLKSIPDLLTIEYDQLCSRPDATVERILQRLERDRVFARSGAVVPDAKTVQLRPLAHYGLSELLVKERLACYDTIFS